MARQNRKWYPGAIYHVMNRGNRKEVIFQDKGDHVFFLGLVKEAKKEYPFTVHSICLMPNHFHLVIETEDSDLGKIMKKILSKYAIFYNKKYTYCGHLFGGRYKASLIEDESYFLEVSRYIHLNPVKAMIVRNPLEYEYSSYRLYVEEELNIQKNTVLRRLSGIVDTSRVLSAFDGNRERYRDFVEGHTSHAEQEQLIMEDMNEDEMWQPKHGRW